VLEAEDSVVVVDVPGVGYVREVSVLEVDDSAVVELPGIGYVREISVLEVVDSVEVPGVG
jgi:hypothetical protein